jgi:hypothetical protein
MTTRSDNDNDVSVASVASVGESYYSSEGGERREEKAQQTTAEDGACCAISSPLLHALAGISASGDGMKTRSVDSTQRLSSRSASPSPSSASSSARDEETTPQRLSGRSLLRTLLPNLRDDEEEEHPSADERHPEEPAQQSEEPPDLLETVVEATRRIEECVERLSRRVAGLESRLDEAILKEDSSHALCRQCCSTRVVDDDDDDDAFFSTPPRAKETPPPETNFCTTPSRLVRASPSPRLVDDFTRLYLVECCETEAE